MFKKVLIASALLASFAGVQAAGSAGFGVVGTITPATCDIVLAGGGLADYGTQTTTAVKALAVTVNSYSLGVKPIGITVTCPSALPVELAFADNKSAQLFAVGDGYDYVRYGVGDGAGTAAIGSSDMYASSVTVDGIAPAGFLAATTGSTAWTATYGANNAGAHIIGPGHAVGFTKTAGATVPTTLTTIGGVLQIAARVSKAYVDSSTSAITLNGSGTITLQYL